MFEALLSRTTSLYESPSTSPVFLQIKYADICAVKHKPFPPGHFLAGTHIAFIVVFLTNNNFGHVCVPIEVSDLCSLYCIVVSTVAYSIMYLQFYSRVFKYW
jgi:hypothetical protein